MATIRETRRYVLAAAAVLLLIDAGLVSFLLSPWGRSPRQLQQHLGELQRELLAKVKQVGPSRGMDKKLVMASKETKGFYDDRLPSLYSEIDEALAAAAKESGVHMSNVRYSNESQEKKDEIRVPEGLRKVNIRLTISGQYVEDVKFINALERSKVFFVIQSVSLAGEGGTAEQQRMRGREASVGLQLGVETYLRRGAAS